MNCPACSPRRRPGDPLPHFSTEEKHRGWFSRQHQTRDAHDAARNQYLVDHGPAARRSKAQGRTS